MGSINRILFIGLLFAMTFLWCLNTFIAPAPAFSLEGLERTEAEPFDQHHKRSGDSLAFIRIPKTGSTSLLTFLYHYAGKKLWSTALSRDYWEERDDREREVLKCIMYGGSLRGMTNVSRPYVCEEEERAECYNCAHATYAELKSEWNALLVNYDRIDASWEPFTIVREPFDRLRSYYYFCRKYVNTTQWHRNQHSEAQYERVISGNFKGWLELVYIEGKRPQLQFEYLHHNIDEAIALVKSSEVMVLVNECFEASLRLMEEKYALSRYAVDTFLQAKDYHTRNDKRVYENEDEAHKLELLRKKAKEWFADEYRFYDAALEQFEYELSRHPLLFPEDCPVLSESY